MMPLDTLRMLMTGCAFNEFYSVHFVISCFLSEGLCVCCKKLLCLLYPRFISLMSCQGLTPYEFVEGMKKKGIRVPGIGHR